MNMLRVTALIGFFVFLTEPLFAQDQPVVGRDAAAKYFQPNASSGSSGGARDHYLALHIGRFTGGQSWDWGVPGRVDDVGRNTFGLTYRLDEWNGQMDFAVRVDFNEYDAAGEKPLKMSLMPVLLFPDATSRFPLYFGAGAGLGIFFKQVRDESPLAFDYQLFMGARFFDVFENSGFFLEAGMKNHLQLTSSGQFNGVFLAAGAVFTF